MKTVLLTLLTITTLICNAQYVTIPDSNFASYLQSTFPNAMSGNQLDTTASVIAQTTKIFIPYNRDITNLSGIQFFDSLLELSCGNQLTNLPALPSSLKILSCGKNQLTNLPALPSSLKILSCGEGQLTNLPELPKFLETLYCGDHLLTHLPTLPDSLLELRCDRNLLDSLPALPNSIISIWCNNNQLITLPTLPDSLLELYCMGNQLITLPTLPDSLLELHCMNNKLNSLPSLPGSIDSFVCDNNRLTSLPTLPNKLKHLECKNNKLTSLPSLPNSLESLICSSNQLTYLPSLPASINVFHCTDNPELECLPYFSQNYFRSFRVKKGTKIKCLPKSIVTNVGDSSTFLPVCDQASSCPIAYNIIGNVWKDTSSDCISDSINRGSQLRGVRVLKFIDGELKNQIYTDAYGVYSFLASTGDSAIVKIVDVNSFLISCPPSGIRTMTLTPLDTLFTNQDFGIKCLGVDVGVQSIQGAFRPTRNRPVYIQAGDVSQQFDLGCANGKNGTVTTTISGSASYVAPLSGALTPSSIVGKTLTYIITDFGTIDPGIAFNIIVRTETNATVGSAICIKTIVSTSASDINSSNDTLEFCGTVVNSFDPNDKAAYPSEVTTPGSWITYTIRFQNTGTDTAYDIFIRDTLSSYLDESTFTYLDGSLRPQISLSEKAVLFNFPNINLLDSFSNEPESHGWLQYKVKTVADLPYFAEINNTAFIYFDLNSPVVTNTTVNEYANRTTQDITSCDSTDVNGKIYYSSQTIIDTIGTHITTTEVVVNSVNLQTTLDGVVITSAQPNAKYQWLDCDNSYGIIASATNQSYTATKNGDYSLEVSFNRCLDTSSCISIRALSVRKKSFKDLLKIYPNPTKGNIVIEFEKSHSQLQAKILSITGQVIATKNVSNSDRLEFDLDAAKGIYFIEITTEEGRAVVRVIKE
jgi:uncharacterized repeat protein (TIGR01451 family)